MKGCLNSACPSGRELWQNQSQGLTLRRIETLWEIFTVIRTVNVACGIQTVNGVYMHITLHHFTFLAAYFIVLYRNSPGQRSIKAK